MNSHPSLPNGHFDLFVPLASRHHFLLYLIRHHGEAEPYNVVVVVIFFSGGRGGGGLNWSFFTCTIIIFIPLGSLVRWFQYLIQRKKDLIATFLCVKIWNGTIPHGIF